MKNIIFLSFLLFGILLSGISQEWLTDFEIAKNTANQDNRTIIMVFQGSDWCAPCIKLDKEVWSTEEFKNFAKPNFVMLKVDFPRKKKNYLSSEQQEKNNTLAESYNKNGYFPFVVVMDKDGKVLGETDYKKIPVSDYIKLLTSFNP